MPSKYYLTLTTYGSDLIAQAHESAPLNLKNLVIGDANGVPYDPLTAIDRTHLVNQKASVLIQHLEVIDDVVRIQATVGANIGGFNIHEIGLTDETGQLVYIGNYHGGYKSLFEDGAGGELTISIDIKGVAANQINLSINPNINTATQTWINQNFIKKAEYDQKVSEMEQQITNLLNDVIRTFTRKFDVASVIYPTLYKANGRTTGVNINYDLINASVCMMPNGYITQTLKLKSYRHDEKLYIYLPVTLDLDEIYGFSGLPQSIAEIDDLTIRIINIELETINDQIYTLVTILPDRVSPIDVSPFDGISYIYLTVTGHTSLKFQNIVDQYPIFKNPD